MNSVAYKTEVMHFFLFFIFGEGVIKVNDIKFKFGLAPLYLWDCEP